MKNYFFLIKKLFRSAFFSSALFALFLLPEISFSQTYPVQLTTQLIPPFSGYIPDFASPGNENLRLLFLFTDFTHTSYDVKLKIKIEGQGITIQSKPYFFSGPVNLIPGVPQMLSGTDLANLLDEHNLDFTGITQHDYDLHKVLPEGFYTVTVTAYDFLNPIPIQVSNAAATQVWMVLNDPPYLNLPFCGSTVTPSSVQQITFSWTAMNLASPSSALGSEYTFELWEIFPANSVPGNIVASTAPLYSNTTTQTILNYGITEPPLVVGREYVWRVHAHDLENRELFRNNGYSELCTFHYGSNLDLLGNIGNLTLHAQPLTHRMAHCWWDSISVYSSYRLEFHKVGSQNWFPVTTSYAQTNIPDLEPNSDYEAHVTGITSSNEEGPQSNTASWHTPLQPILNCGESSPPPTQQNFHPLTQATTGMIWQVGQFEMQVTSLNNFSSAGGWYSGLGKVVMPLGWTVNCSFSNVQMGDDHVMYAGEVRAVTEGITNWERQYTMNQLLAYVDTVISETIDTILVNGNLITIQTDSGNITINAPGYPFVIQDGNGTTYTVNSDGTYTIQFLVPHIPLTEEQITIYKLALHKMKIENTTTDINSAQNNLQTAKTNYFNYTLSGGIDLNSSSSFPAEFVSVNESSYDSSNAVVQPPSQQAAVKTAEYNYLRVKVYNAFAKENPSSYDLDLLANYVIIDDKLSYLYIAERIAAGDSDNAIAEDVKENIYKFIDNILVTEVFIKP